MPHFCSVFFVCLYQRYLSLKIEQLFDVFFGIDEQADIKKNIKINDFDSAIKTIDKTIEMDRDDPDGYYKKALIYVEQNNYVKAMSLISNSILRLEDSEIENKDFYIQDIDGKKRISLSDLYLYRAEISKKLGDVSYACEDINTALSKSKTEDEKEKIEKRISLECN